MNRDLELQGSGISGSERYDCSLRVPHQNYLHIRTSRSKDSTSQIFWCPGAFYVDRRGATKYSKGRINVRWCLMKSCRLPPECHGKTMPRSRHGSRTILAVSSLSQMATTPTTFGWRPKCVKISNSFWKSPFSVFLSTYNDHKTHEHAKP